MATRDILVLNTTASRAETQQGSDTVRLKGTGEILSIENSSASPILSFKSDDSQTILEGKITSTGNLTGVITGSFGKVEGKTLIGSAAFLTNTDKLGTLSSSAQIASKITGSFRAGFQFSGTISGSGGSTGSFDKITATTFAGDASNLTNSQITNTLSSSAQIASDISGSFNKGFEFSGHISGSGASTGSFGRIETTTITGDGYELTNYIKEGTISSSAQIAADVSASFNKGFNFDGEISASISGSVSLNTLTAQTLVGDGSALTNTIPTGTVSGSAQLASRISGSFNKGFEYSGTIIKSPAAWSATNAINTARTVTTAFGSQNATVLAGGNNNPVSPGAHALSETWNGTNWSEGNDLIQKRSNAGSAGTATSGLVFGGSASPSNNLADTETYDGTSYSEVNNLTTGRYALAGFGTQPSAIAAGGAVPNYNNLKSCTEEWNGTNWSEVNNLSYTSWYAGTAGDSSESGILFGGSHDAYGTATAKTSLWNGTNWSEVGDMNTARVYMRGQGSTNNAIGVGGLPGGTSGAFSTCTETWDGSSWSTAGSMIVANRYAGVGGNGSGAIAAGFSQDPSPYSNNNSELFETFFNSGSFGQVKALQFVGSGANITDFTKPSNIHSGSAQFTGISGSFNKGFEFVGTISGSSTSTGSFGRLVATTFAGDGSGLTNTQLDGTVSSSAQIDSDIKGAFNKGFEYSGEIRTAKGVWSTGGSMNAARRCHAGSGTQNAALATGGQTANAPSNAYVKNTEEYNGSSWTAGNNMITYGRQRAQVGTQNASLLFGGYNTCDDTEEYNGTNFATAGNLAVGRYAINGFGTQNAAFGASGTVSNRNGTSNSSEQYDGAAWSNSVSMIASRFLGGGVGTQNAGIVGYGQCGNNNTGDARARNCTELWNGTSWSETSEALIAGEQGVQSGTQNAFAVTAGCDGAIPSSTSRATTQFFDGISYSMDGDLITAAFDRCGANKAAQDAGLVFGGGNPTNIANTEEYNTYYTTGSFGRIETDDVQIAGDSQLVVSASLQLPVFTSNSGIVSSSAGQMWFNSTTKKLNFTMDVNAWSAGADMNEARGYGGLTGTQNAAILVAGDASGTPTAHTEQYNGSAWSVTEDHDLGRAAQVKGQVMGTQNSAIAAGGHLHPATQALTETFNGSSWTEVGDLNKTRRHGHGLGTQNAALLAAGSTTTPTAEVTAETEEWNGTAWTSVSDIASSRAFGAAAGTQNAGLIFGGSTNSSTSNTVGQTETYDGTAWTERNDMNVARQSLGGGGTQNAALVHNGALSPSTNVSANTEEWNGTSWSTANVVPTTFRNADGAGSQAAGIVAGGEGSGYCDTTYEYSVSHLKTVEIDGV